MGNLSSAPFKTQNQSNSKLVAKLVDSQGQLRLVNLPTTVGELMLENPGFALTPVEELRKTLRLSAMKADDMLLGRKVYLLMPVGKVNSRLTDLQMAAIDSLLCGRTRGGFKESPVLWGACLESSSDKSTNVIGQRKGFCRVWEPVLEPILEGC